MNDDGKGNHTIKGSLISGANQDCGQVLSAKGGKLRLKKEDTVFTHPRLAL